MGLLAKLTFVQIVGVAKLFELDNEVIKESLLGNSTEELVVQMVVAFQNKNRKSRRQILKFLKSVVEENARDEKIEKATKDSSPEDIEVMEDGTEEVSAL